MNSPADEILKFMDMALEQEQSEAEHERAKMYIQYLSNVFSQQQEGKPDPKFMQAKREFEKMLKPETPQGPAEIYDWDFERMKRLKIEQEGR